RSLSEVNSAVNTKTVTRADPGGNAKSEKQHHLGSDKVELVGRDMYYGTGPVRQSEGKNTERRIAQAKQKLRLPELVAEKHAPSRSVRHPRHTAEYSIAGTHSRICASVRMRVTSFDSPLMSVVQVAKELSISARQSPLSLKTNSAGSVNRKSAGLPS